MSEPIPEWRWCLVNGEPLLCGHAADCVKTGGTQPCKYEVAPADEDAACLSMQEEQSE